MKTCAQCDSDLESMRATYCSSICKSRAYNEARKADGRLKAEREKRAPQRAAWAKANAHRYKGKYDETVQCPGCDREFVRNRSQPEKHRTCSQACAATMRRNYSKLPADHPVRQRIRELFTQLSPVRQALRDGNADAVVDALRADTIPTADGCWEWQRFVDKSGYGKVAIGPRGKSGSTHRVMAEAVYGPLGIEPVHHKCANTRCINPDHLQPISQRENVAEMMQRNYYLARISELEAALGASIPDHPALLGRAS